MKIKHRLLTLVGILWTPGFTKLNYSLLARGQAKIISKDGLNKNLFFIDDCIQKVKVMVVEMAF